MIFSVYAKKEKIHEQSQKINLIKGQTTNEITLDLKKIAPGLLKITITKQGEEKSLTEESIMYGAKITGNVIDNLLNNNTSSIIIIITVFLILAGIIIKRILIKRIANNKKLPNKQLISNKL